MSKISDLLTYGLGEVGKPYVYGAEGPSTFDCSGLIQYIFGHVGVKLPRTADQQYHFATPIGTPSPGDLVFYVDQGGRATHVALYLGNGKVLQAPHTGADVDVVTLFELAGHTRHYGRIPGVGGTLAAVGSTIVSTVGNPLGSVSSTISGTVDSVLGGARQIVLEAGFALIGAGIIGLGLYTMVNKRKASAS